MTQYGTMIWGSRALSPSVTIGSGNNRLTVSVDGASYSVTLDNGDYFNSKERFDSDLVTHINVKYGPTNPPFMFRLGGIRDDLTRLYLVIEHKDKTDDHMFDDVSGSAAAAIFGTIAQMWEHRSY